MNNIVQFINKFRLDGGSIWLEEDSIRLSTSKELQNQAIKDFIQSNKIEITSILKTNKVFTKKDFLHKKILKYTIDTDYPLSSAQERLWFIEQYEAGTNAYHIPMVFELAADANIDAIKYAINQIISRHEILRSTIEQGCDQAGVQIIHERPLSMDEIRVTDEDDYRAVLKIDINRPFDFRSEYPIRVKFYRIDGEAGRVGGKTFILVNTHHIASDGWSLNIFERELHAFYNAYIHNSKSFNLPDLEIQYKDYALWQKTNLTGEVLANQLIYWKSKLSGYQTLELPTDYARPSQMDYAGSVLHFTLNKNLSDSLRGMAQRYGVTLNTVLLTSINILLSKYTGQEDIVVGSPIANRHHRQTEGLIGFFVNTQANRTLLSKSQSVEDLLQQVHLDQRAAQLHQDLPFEKLVVELKVERDSSRHPVFQVMFGVQSFNRNTETIDGQNSYFKPAQGSFTYGIEKFDLSIFINDGQEELSGRMSYATSLFHKDTIARLVDHYKHLLEQLTRSPQKAYSEFTLLDEASYNQIVYQWNDTAKDYPNKTIDEVFQEQVEKTPDNIALVYGGQKLTYQELNQKSNQLARHLRDQYKKRTNQDLAAGTLIALCLDRSLEMVIGTLAIVKAGGAYVPIDPSYPQERIDYLLADTKATLVLGQRACSENYGIQLPKDKVVYVELTEKLYTETDTTNLPSHGTASDLAYVIYTSGTTGKPRGVMIEQKSVLSLVYNDYVQVQADDVFAFLSSPVFDASTFEIWTPLLKGNSLIIPGDLKNLISDTRAFDAFITNNNVTILWLTKTLFESLYHLDHTLFKTLNYLIIGGEALDKITVNNLVRSHVKPKHFLNGYGPTESTTFTCTYNLRDQVGSTNVPIGTPISNRSVYVLDPNFNPVPLGAIGELYIGGAGLARGYLNNKELTAERFITNPFATETDKAKGLTRLYKTGDLVRWLSDGNLEYVGRNDDQVKIRGYRIELGEIEHALAQVPGIKQSCVLVKERETESGSTKYLVGYYVLDTAKILTQEVIQEKLSTVLPEYMVPTAFVAMDSFPLTINGKLDKRALPDPDVNSGEEGYVAPTTDLEIRLCDIYAEVLGLSGDQIGTHQNFFKIGGNSILTMQLKNKLNQLPEFKHTGVADLFKYNTIHKLIESAQRENETVYKLQPVTRNNNHEVAIIGVSGAFSGANNIDELWQLIANQKEGIHFFSKDECKQLQVDEALLANANYVPVAGKVADIEQFDPLFWGLSPNEAKLLDPQIRKFIEHCWFVLESSGYAQQRKNHNIGVFAGSGNGTYWQKHIVNGESAENIDKWEAMISNNKDALATKTAFLLGLSGPANSINTACSTGLVSVVEACYKLQLGICDMALAGGVSLSMPDQIGYIYKEGMIVSKDGHCRTFDKDASGTTGGSGVGVVLLKRLEDAIKDEDSILGVIKGYATNNDGDRKTGYTAPSVIGQSECIINAQKMAGITPDQIDYIECHGTATHLGDPIEVQALREAFEYNQSKKNNTNHKTILGAVKANIGHTDSAAGTAGLIKVCAMLRHNVIPGQVNFSEPNPEMQLERTNFEILKENRVWLPSVNKQRLAGVSAFGVGGTNAHVIIGDYNVPKKHNAEYGEGVLDNKLNTDLRSAPYIIPLSAKSRQSLEHYKQALLNYLTQQVDTKISIENIAYTLQEKREHFKYRVAYCVADAVELINKLKQEALWAEANADDTNKIVYMFPGQGVQYTHMAKTLYDNEPLFKATIDQCIAVANQHLDVDLYQVMYPEGESVLHDINQTQWTQISLFIIEYALAKYLDRLGVRADAYIGHSVGEYVAATVSGVFSLEDAIRIVIARGKLMMAMQPGCMLAIKANEEFLKPIVKAHNCEIAAVNSAEDIVVSGNDVDSKKLQEELEKQSIPAILLTTSHAYHSSMMEQAAINFEKAFENIELRKPAAKFVSNLTGEIANDHVVKPSYWSKQLRNTVRFAEGIDTLSKHFNHQISFIEIGVGKGLTYFVNKYAKANNHKSIQGFALLPTAKEAKAVDRHAHTLESKEAIQAKLWMIGIVPKPNESRLFRDAVLHPGLPLYQFNNQKCWIEKKASLPTNELKLLPEENWLSAPTWSAVHNLTKYDGKPIFNNALLFIREDQLRLFDLGMLAQNIHVIILDINNPDVDTTRSDRHVIINPENERHFEKLADWIKSKGFVFETIIHASSIDIAFDIHVGFAYGFYSLFLIRQHLLHTSSLENLLVLTNGLAQITNDDGIHPSNGALVGAVRNINHEFFHIDSRIIDTGYNQKNITADIAQIWNKRIYRKSNELLAIRFGKQWIEGFEKIDHSLTEQGPIADGDIILITGGLGGVALSIAKHISGKHAVKFILVSRKNIFEKNQSDYIKEKIAIIDGIKANGSAVDIQCGDISRVEFIQALVNSVKKTHGNITGIIHTAGVSPLSTDKYTVAEIKNSFKGKVYGIKNITECVNMTQVKFIASTSSLASIMGDVNRIEYCASNSYLDYLALDKLKFKNTKVISINWPGWSDIGMVREHEAGNEGKVKPVQDLQRLMRLNSVEQNEGATLFYRLINQENYERVVISKLDIHGLKEKLFAPDKSPSHSAQVTIVEDAYTDTEYQVAQIVAEVLGIEEISLHDDFFKLGGNSILAIQVSHKISKALSCDVRVADIFEQKTIAQLLLHSVGQTQVVISKKKSVNAVLSFAQERLWFIEQYERGTNAYHIPTVFELAAGTDVEGIKYALQQIVSRHEILRSTIEMDDDHQGMQVVHEMPLSIEEVEVTDKDDYKTLLKDDINRPFDLSSEYPIRVKFYRIHPPGWEGGSVAGRTLLLVNTHHIASDGWSVGIFQRELSAFYKAYRNNNTTFALPQLEIQYKDYAVWQKNHLTGEVLANQLNYWKNKLAGYQTLELPTDYARPGQINYAGSTLSFKLDKNLSNSLRDLAQVYGVTLHTVLLSSVNILLSKYTGQDDIVVGSAMANRHHRQTEGLIGFFINTQANRTLLSKSQSFEDLIQQVHQDQTAAQLHQDLPFEKLVDELKIERDTSRHPVFQVMLGVQGPWQDSKAIDEQRKYFKPFQGSAVYEIEQFDLSIFINDRQEELSGKMSYATSLFQRDTIARLIDHFKHLLEQLTQAPQKHYSQISLLHPEEYKKIVYEWNATDKEYSEEKTIYELFQEQAERTPENIALVYNEQKLTYQELNERSNQLARCIRKQYKKKTKQDLAPNTLIALCLDRSLEMVIGILAVLKAGGAYVPIDPSFPQDRVDYLLNDTQAVVVLTQRRYIESGTKLPKDKVMSIELTEELYSEETDFSNLPSHSTAADLAYVIYTSGTTGKPKGAMLCHKGIVNRLEWMQAQYPLNSTDVVLQKTPYVFDVSVWELLWANWYGAKIVMAKPDGHKDSKYLHRIIEENKVTTLHFVPSMLEAYNHHLLEHQVKFNSSVKHLFCSGEALTKNVAQQTYKNSITPTFKLHNLYGPTEASIDVTFFETSADGSVCIGKPIQNTQAYVLDSNYNPIPVGVIGRIIYRWIWIGQGISK
jgi:amino acid adenylation domain-containing protein